MQIEYRAAKVTETEEILRFLKEDFFKDEPICASMGWGPDDEPPSQHIKHTIKEGTSIVAIARTAEHPEGVLAGVRIGGPHVETEKSEAQAPAGKWDKVMDYLEYIESKSRLTERFGVPSDKIFYGLMLGVDRRFRGHSIGIELYKKSFELARSLGYTLYVCDCTSFYSARLCEKLGMELVSSIPYAEYVDEYGQPIFNPPLPHTATNSFALFL